MPKLLRIPKTSLWDSVNQEFVDIEESEILFEHSLISISKWESKWHKPFLSSNQKTSQETIDYLHCMVISRTYNPTAINVIASDQSLSKEINDYIEDSMTATTFTEHGNSSKKKEVITSELIYYWMTEFNIPYKFERWHLNRLLTLIRICAIKNTPNSKMNKKDIYSQNRSLNAARRKALRSRG